MRRASFAILAAVSLLSPVSAQELDRLQIEARELLADALRQHGALQDAGDARERLAYLEAISALLGRIETEYAASDIGLSILMGESFGPLDPAAVRADLESVRADVAEIMAAEAQLAAAEAASADCLATLTLRCVTEDLLAQVAKSVEDLDDDAFWPFRLAVDVFETGPQAIPADAAARPNLREARDEVTGILARAGRFAELEAMLTSSPLALPDGRSVWDEIERNISGTPALFHPTSPLQEGLAGVVANEAAHPLIFRMGGPPVIAAMLEAKGPPVEALRASLASGEAAQDGFAGVAALVALSLSGHHDAALEIARGGAVEVSGSYLYDLRNFLTDAQRAEYDLSILEGTGSHDASDRFRAFRNAAALAGPDAAAPHLEAVAEGLERRAPSQWQLFQVRYSGMDAGLRDRTDVRDWADTLDGPLGQPDIRASFEDGWILGQAMRDDNLDTLAENVQGIPDFEERLSYLYDLVYDLSYEGRTDLARELVGQVGIFENIDPAEGLGDRELDGLLGLVAAGSANLDYLATMMQADLVPLSEYDEIAWTIGDALAFSDNLDRYEDALRRILASVASAGEIERFLPELVSYVPDDAPRIQRLLHKISITAETEVAGPVLLHLFQTYDPRLAEG
jgi:hypothetical protein